MSSTDDTVVPTLAPTPVDPVVPVEPTTVPPVPTNDPVIPVTTWAPIATGTVRSTTPAGGQATAVPKASGTAAPADPLPIPVIVGIIVAVLGLVALFGFVQIRRNRAALRRAQRENPDLERGPVSIKNLPVAPSPALAKGVPAPAATASTTTPPPPRAQLPGMPRAPAEHRASQASLTVPAAPASAATAPPALVPSPAYQKLHVANSSNTSTNSTNSTSTTPNAPPRVVYPRNSGLQQ